ncbi:unnamed protein product [Acanthoscelides obtectus]|uniref:DDE Tnp4 domain-containing protein n=1 Tax=Acanthoscelides obtectus TaxID=200917 RepID=A0A9P0JPL8_ACAOB|nr:unnamed protein product [Acanthoscelides obtectus]CAK1661065.1 hypothetical protein AOBTE_LOCUS22411 [Acanthoscelides obtectus]
MLMTPTILLYLEKSQTPDYRFVYVDIGSYGKDCDSAIFQRTNFYQLLTEGRLSIPPPVPLHSSQNNRMPHVILGDEAFQLTEHLLRPFGGNHLDVKKLLYQSNHEGDISRRNIEVLQKYLVNIIFELLKISAELSNQTVNKSVAVVEEWEVFLYYQSFKNVEIFNIYSNI